MIRMRRFVMVILLAVAAMSALRPLPSLADMQLHMTAQHHCDCADGCTPSTKACGLDGLCASTCNAIAVDIAFALPRPFVSERIAGTLAAAHESVERPPPLQPPTA